MCCLEIKKLIIPEKRGFLKTGSDREERERDRCFHHSRVYFMGTIHKDTITSRVNVVLNADSIRSDSIYINSIRTSLV